MMSKLAEAQAYYREALEGFRRVLGDDHPKTLNSMNNMGGLLQLIGKLGEAEALAREALEGRRQVLRERHPSLASSLMVLGMILIDKAEHNEAETLLRECLSIRKEALPEDHWRNASAKSVLGASLAGQGMLAEAEPMLLEGYAGLKDNPSASDIRKREALERIVELYDAWQAAEPDAGHDAKAAEWRAKLPPEPTSQPAE